MGICDRGSDSSSSPRRTEMRTLLVIVVGVVVIISQDLWSDQGGSQREGIDSTAQMQVDSVVDRVQQIKALFKIIDPEALDRILSKKPTNRQFLEATDRWTDMNAERWSEIQTRLGDCEELHLQGLLGPPYYAEIPDVRWGLLIRYGRPSNQLIAPCACESGIAGCTLWTYTWPPDSINVEGEEISCQSTVSESYPTQIVEDDENSFPQTSTLRPSTSASRFRNTEGGYDVWISAWIPGNQFTRATLESGLLRISCELFDSAKSAPIRKDSTICNLQAVRGILEATVRPNRRFIRAMGYLCLSSLTPGRYFAHLQLAGGEENSGERWIEIRVESDFDISDMLLIKPSLLSGSNTLPGIVRGVQGSLYDDPECVFSSGTRLRLYAELATALPEGSKLRAVVSILKLPDLKERRIGKVSSGIAVAVSDSLDRPFAEREFDSNSRDAVLRSMNEDSQFTKNQILLDKMFESAAEITPIDLSVDLKKNLKGGRYLLTMTVSDPTSQSFYLSTRREIRVVAAK